MSETPTETKLCPFRRESGPGFAIDKDGKKYSMSLGDFAPCLQEKCALWVLEKDTTRTLKNGMVAIVDSVDSDILAGQSWWWHGRYVKGNNTYLHRAIMEKQFGPIPNGMVTDHIDGDPLNNRRSNLRICFQAENVRNNKPKPGKTSRFKGVWKNTSGRWVSQLTYKGERTCIGVYDTEEEAAKEYDDLAKSLADEYMRINLSPTTNYERGHCGLAGKP